MIDPELETVLEFMPVIDLDDPVVARREFEKLIVAMRTPMPEEELLDIEDRMIPGWEGDPEVSVRVYRPKAIATDPGTTVPGILQIHGGGFIVGSVESEHAGAVLTAANLGAVLVSVEYRLAPEHPYPAGLHDCYAALSFLHAEAGALGVDPERIALTGASAGGGLAAGTALLARDRGGPPVCFQMLHIPELDDRLETPSMQKFVDSPLWNRPLAVKSWQFYLGDLSGTADVPIYAAPARATDLAGLPPAYVSTAENDPLRDEGIAYASAMLQAGVSVELHQFPGTFHGSALVTGAAVSRRAAQEASVVLRRALGVAEA
jgi:acetyl esterase/lipase